MAQTDEALKRLGGGRWATKDGRFTIEPQGGTWSLVDVEQTDELGLPLVRGPYRSLTAAKEAIAEARGGDAPASPLAARAEEIQERAAAAPARPSRRPRRAAGRRSAPEPDSKPRDAAGPPSAGTGPSPAPEIPDTVRVETIWVVEVPYTADAAEKRPAVRHEHLTRIGELLADGRLIEAGGYLDMSSAVLLVRAASEEEAIALFRDDVYVRCGVWTDQIRARPWGRVVPATGS